MTWIVGASVVIGYAVGISDIRVRLRTGQERDILQKLYPMARFIAAGFAGSVRIGFAMLKGLADQLPDIPEDHSFVPQPVVETLSPLAKDIFKNSAVSLVAPACSQLTFWISESRTTLLTGRRSARPTLLFRKLLLF